MKIYQKNQKEQGKMRGGSESIIDQFNQKILDDKNWGFSNNDSMN